MADHLDPLSTWSGLFEKVIVPIAGLAVFVYAAVGGPVPIPLYPLVAAAIGFPAFRALDRLKQNGTK